MRRCRALTNQDTLKARARRVTQERCFHINSDVYKRVPEAAARVRARVTKKRLASRKFDTTWTYPPRWIDTPRETTIFLTIIKCPSLGRDARKTTEWRYLREKLQTCQATVDWRLISSNISVSRAYALIADTCHDRVAIITSGRHTDLG